MPYCRRTMAYVLEEQRHMPQNALEEQRHMPEKNNGICLRRTIAYALEEQ